MEGISRIGDIRIDNEYYLKEIHAYQTTTLPKPKIELNRILGLELDVIRWTFT